MYFSFLTTGVQSQSPEFTKQRMPNPTHAVPTQGVPNQPQPTRMGHPGTVRPATPHPGTTHAVTNHPIVPMSSHRPAMPPSTTHMQQTPTHYPPNMDLTARFGYQPFDPRQYSVNQNVPRQNVPISVQNQFHSQAINGQRPATSQIGLQQMQQGPISPPQVQIVPQIPGQGTRQQLNHHLQQRQGQQVHLPQGQVQQVLQGQGHQVHPGQQVLSGQGHAPGQVQWNQVHNPMGFPHLQSAANVPIPSHANTAPWPNPQAPHVTVNISPPQNHQTHQARSPQSQTHQRVGVNQGLPVSSATSPPQNTNVQPNVNPVPRLTHLNQAATGQGGETPSGSEASQGFSWYNMEHQAPGAVKTSPSAKLKPEIASKVEPFAEIKVYKNHNKSIWRASYFL